MKREPQQYLPGPVANDTMKQSAAIILTYDMNFQKLWKYESKCHVREDNMQ